VELVKASWVLIWPKRSKLKEVVVMDMAQRIAADVCKGDPFLENIVLKIYEGKPLTGEEAAYLMTEEGAWKVSYAIYYLYYWLSYTYG
jgi:hypothetical protein